MLCVGVRFPVGTTEAWVAPKIGGKEQILPPKIKQLKGRRRTEVAEHGEASVRVLKREGSTPDRARCKKHAPP